MESEGEPVEKFVLRDCYEFIENILNISIFGSQFFVNYLLAHINKFEGHCRSVPDGYI